MNRVLVLDGGTLSALAATRALGANGIEVTCGESYRHNPSFYSRHAQNTVAYADPVQYPDRFLDDLEEHLSQTDYETVLPMRGITTMLLAEHRHRFERRVRLCLADHTALSIGFDKGKTVDAALEFGVPVPETFFPERQSLTSIADSVRFPALIKPRKSSGGRGIAFARDPDSLLELYPKVKARYGEPIIQEQIAEGRTHLSACFLFNAASQLRAAFVYEELRHFPVRGGPASFAVSVKRPDAVELGASLLASLGWRGVAHMDLVVDPEDGKIKLLEINPRFWTSLALAVDAGVDFPGLLCAIITEGDVEPVTSYQTGRYYRWLLPADILWLTSSKKRWAHVREFARFRRDMVSYAVCSAADPKPMLGAVVQAVYFIARRSTRDYILDRGW